MLDKINCTNTYIVNSKYYTPSFYTYYLNNYNKEENINELLFSIEENLHKLSIKIQNYHIFIQGLYNLLQNCNFVVKFDLNNLIGNNKIDIINFNYIFLLNNNTAYYFNFNTVENLIKSNQLIPYLYNIKKEIPNQAKFFNNNHTANLKLVENYKINTTPQSTNTSLISYPNLSKQIFETGKMRNNYLCKRTSSIKRNRKSKEKMLLRKRESLHYFTDSELFIERKRENSKKSSMKNSSKGDNLTQKTYKRSNSNHGNFKRLNNEIISKYYLYQKKKEQLSNLINQSCEVIEKSDNQIFQPEKIKKIFKGKYIKNLCQKINIFQNNLRDYCNNENYEFKLDQGHKIWNFSLKSPKSISINQLCKKKLSNNSSLSQNNSNEKPINISNELLKSKVDIIPTIQTTPINIEFQINKNNLYLKSELNKSLQALKRTTLSENKKNNEENYLEKDNKPSSNPVNNIIEKSSVLQSSEVASLENANPVITNSRRNKRTKHNRSSAVCLSSNDIKGILNETKRNDTTPNNSEDKEQKSTHQKFSKEQLERRKLLSRDNYHPSLTTLNSTQFCYNKYYPSISLPSIQRSSQFLQQQWINNRRLNV